MNEGPPHLVYTIRPNGTALWLPAAIASAIRAGHGHKLSEEEYNAHGIQALLEKRRDKKAK